MPLCACICGANDSEARDLRSSGGAGFDHVDLIIYPCDDIATRLLAIETEIERWLTQYQPDTVAVERVFSQHNVRTVMGTAQAGAVAIVCAARRGLPVALHTPSEVKAAVTGNGRADKDQVTTMVMRLLRMPERPRPPDAADALALAICHLWRTPAIRARQPSMNGGDGR